MKKNTILAFGVGTIAFLAGIAVGAGVVQFDTVSPVLSTDVRDKVLSARYTNPLLECSELPESISIGDRIRLQKNIEEKIEDAKNRGTITDAAVYFRDLNNGPWFGIREEQKFYPASLLKIPLAMWYYWRADSDPALLDDQIEFTGPPGVSVVHYKPTRTLEASKTYTVNELIHLMLEESDNDAAHILYEYLGTEKSEQVYRDLGVGLTPDPNGTPIDVRTFASFFRILYNATYLGRSLSEHMLETMTRSSFEEGLVAGVPENIPVAHKFGEKSLDSSGTNVQLHDCGIVYHPSSPYLLCVMSQGPAYTELAGFIASVSETVYAYVDD